MTDARNTGRRPNIHWYGRDLIAEGFFAELIEEGAGGMILGLHLPVEYLRAWLKLIDGDLSDEGRKEAEAIMRHNPPDLTWRMDNVERTLCGSYDQSHTCPPDCS